MTDERKWTHDTPENAGTYWECLLYYEGTADGVIQADGETQCTNKANNYVATLNAGEASPALREAARRAYELHHELRPFGVGLTTEQRWDKQAMFESAMLSMFALLPEVVQKPKGGIAAVDIDGATRGGKI